jgi:hypothetical protein
MNQTVVMDMFEGQIVFRKPVLAEEEIAQFWFLTLFYGILNPVKQGTKKAAEAAFRINL